MHTGQGLLGDRTGGVAESPAVGSAVDPAACGAFLGPNPAGAGHRGEIMARHDRVSEAELPGEIAAGHGPSLGMK
jgi:hypothetical protein